jgi:tetratricopeptide (TPR) repeat protein
MAAMAAGTWLLATYHAESSAALDRLRRGQHEDFGKALRTEKKPPRQVRLPIFGPTRVRMLAAVCIFLLVSGWWLTPLAPVTVRPRPLKDLLIPLQVEITATVLAEPDEDLAVAELPSIPPSVVQEARRIGPTASQYQRGMKALAEQRFDEARRLLAAAEVPHPAAEPSGKESVPRWKVVVAQGQNEFFAGRFADAAECFNRARKLQPDEPATICQAAAARLHAGQVPEAGALAAEALKMAREKPAGEDLALAAALHLQAVVDTIRAEHLDNVEPCNTEAQGIWGQNLGESSSAVAASQNNQAVFFALRSLYSGADTSQIDAQGNWSKTLPSEHPYLAALAGNRAVLLLTEGKYAEASKMIAKEGGQSLESVPAADRPRNVRLLLTTAMVEERLAQYGDAATKASQALSGIQGRLGAEHPMIAAALEVLAAIETGQGRYNKAERYALRAREVAEKSLGREHPYVAHALTNLASLDLLRGQPGDVQPAITRVLAIAKKSLGEEHPLYARGLWLRGRWELVRKQPAQGRASLQAALEILKKVFPGGHPDIAAVEGDLAALQSDPAKSVAAFDEAIAMAEQFCGPQHPLVADLLIGRARRLLEAGKAASAAESASRALAIRKKILPPDHPKLAEALEVQAQVLRATGKPADRQQAATLEKQAQEVRAKHEENERAE